MTQDKTQAKPDAADTARTVSKQAEQQTSDRAADDRAPDDRKPDDHKSDDRKPDEGIRPDALTSESDGGSQG